MSSKWMLAGLLALGVLAGPGCNAQTTPPPGPSAAKPTDTPAQPRASGEIKTADDLLSRLETSDKDLKSLSAGMLYDRVFGLAGDRQVRKGQLHYVDSKAKDDKGQPAPGSRKFAITFEKLKLGDQPWRDQPKTMIFDGHWLIEKMPEEKQVIKREVVPAGKAFDALKIGEGPFPIPVGQKKDDILKRFNAQLLPTEEGIEGNEPADTPKLKDFVTKAKAWQLKLTPKSPDQDFKEIRLWYSQQESTGMLLPVMARTVNQQDDVSLVELVNVKINQEPPADVFDPNVPSGWQVSVEELKPENRR